MFKTISRIISVFSFIFILSGIFSSVPVSAADWDDEADYSDRYRSGIQADLEDCSAFIRSGLANINVCEGNLSGLDIQFLGFNLRNPDIDPDNFNNDKYTACTSAFITFLWDSPFGIQNGNYPFYILNFNSTTDDQRNELTGEMNDYLTFAISAFLNSNRSSITTAQGDEVACFLSERAQRNDAWDPVGAIVDLTYCDIVDGAATDCEGSIETNPNNVRIRCDVGDTVCQLTAGLQNIFNEIGPWLIGALGFVVAFIFFIIGYILQFVLRIVSLLANEILLINPASDQFFPIVRETVGLVSNLANIILVGVIVWIGIQFIWTDKGQKISDLLARVAVIALGINFSTNIAALIVALCYQLGALLNGFLGGADTNMFVDYASVVRSSLGQLTAVENTDFSQAGFTALSNFSPGLVAGTRDVEFWNIMQLALVYVALAFVYFYAVYVLIKMLGFLSVRLITLFFVLITAPVAFVLLISPNSGLQKYGQQWLSILLNYSIAYPFIIIAVRLGTYFIFQVGERLATTPFTADSLPSIINNLFF